MTERTYRMPADLRTYFREYQRERRARIKLGLRPGLREPIDPNPAKPRPDLRLSDKAEYMRQYMRWWRAKGGSRKGNFPDGAK
jgi:hypothetical protein